MSVVSEIRQYKTGKFYRDDFRGKMSWNGNEHNVMLRNEGVGPDGVPRFADVGMAMGADDTRDARGMAVADFDNDGDLDIVVNTHPGDCGVKSVPPVLLRNDIGHARRWLAVKLTGAQSNRDAIGAQVSVRFVGEDGTKQALLRHVTAGGGFASQNTDRLYFGLGSATEIESVQVRWPTGVTQEFKHVPVNRLLEVTEGQSPSVRKLPISFPVIPAQAGIQLPVTSAQTESASDEETTS